MSYKLHVRADALGAAAACAAYIASTLRRELSRAPLATLAVSGGSTPRLMFDVLAGEPLDWSRIHVFFVDERSVPPGDPQSNYTLCETHLLTPAKVPEANVHRILAEHGASAAAGQYRDEILAFFGHNDVPSAGKGGEAAVAAGDAIPQFSVIQCGIGPDCHTASLFPGDPLIMDREGLVAAVEVAKLHQTRVTLLPGVLTAAAHVAVLACGAEKAEALDHAFHAPLDLLQYPAQLLVHECRSDFFLDRAAARLPEPA